MEGHPAPRPPPSSSGAPRCRDAVQPARCCPASSRCGAQHFPLHGDAGERLGPATGCVDADPLSSTLPSPACPCPGSCCSSLSAATPLPRRGQPDLWGNLLPCRGAFPSCSPSARSRLRFLFLGGCGLAAGLVATGPKGQLSGCRGQLDTGPWWGTRSSLVLPHSRQQEEGRGRGLGAGSQGGPNPAVVQGPMGPDPYSCAVHSSLAPAWPLGAGSREGSRHLHFRRLFSGAGEKPRRDEIVTKETRETGPSTGKWWAARRGEGKGPNRPRAHTSAPPLGLKNLPMHPAFTCHTGGTEP